MPKIPSYIYKLAKEQNRSPLEALASTKKVIVSHARQLQQCSPKHSELSMRQIVTSMSCDVDITDAEIEGVIRKEQDALDREADMTDDEWLDASIAGAFCQ